MPDNSPKTLVCPSCGAPLDFDGSSSLVRCKFCKTTAVMPGFEKKQAVLTPDSLDEIRNLVQSGNMIEAIRRFREMTGLDLKRAKEAVEQLASGRVMVANRVVVGTISPEETGRILEQVQDMLRSDDKSGAIHYYREATDVSQMKASQVIEQVEAALKGLPAPQFAEIPGQPSLNQQLEKYKQRRLFALLLTSLILLLVGAFVAVMVFLASGTSKINLVANGPALLTTSTVGNQALVSEFYNVTDETYLVGMLDRFTGKLLWKTEPLPSDCIADAIAQSGDLVYVACLSDLLAYNVDDGTQVWRVVMPDRLNYSESNLLITNGRILTNNADQSIQAYDAATGRLVWDRRLAGYDRGLRLVDGSLMVFDYTDGGYTYNLFFLDPLDGTEQRLITPSCPTSEFSPATIDIDSGFLYDEAGNTVYLVYDSSPGCIQRLDLASGQPTWSTLDEGWYTFSADGFQGLLTADRLYFSTGNQIKIVDKTTGQLQTMLEDSDYELLPLAVSENVLLIRMRRTRGTEIFELRGIDTGTGQMLWRQDMGTAQPIDPPDDMIGLVDKDDTGWTWHLGDTGGIILIQFQGEPNQMFIQFFKYSDGSFVGEVTVPLKSVSGDFYSAPKVIVWSGDYLYLSIDGDIYCINVPSGEVVFHT